MGVAIKKIKPEAVKLQLGVALHLPRLFSAFRAPTYGDQKRLDKLTEVLAKTGEQQQQLIQDFFTTNNLPIDEQITATHPLSADLNELLANSETDITRPQTQVFSKDEFIVAVNGTQFTYGERKMLEYWLVR